MPDIGEPVKPSHPFRPGSIQCSSVFWDQRTQPDPVNYADGVGARASNLGALRVFQRKRRGNRQGDWRSRKRDWCHRVASPDAPDRDLKPGTWTRRIVSPIFFYSRPGRSSRESCSQVIHKKSSLNLPFSFLGEEHSALQKPSLNDPLLICPDLLSGIVFMVYFQGSLPRFTFRVHVQGSPPASNVKPCVCRLHFRRNCGEPQ